MLELGALFSLNRRVPVLGLPSLKSDGINGSRAQGLSEQSQHRTISDYWFRDVKLTRAIYHRMVFEDSERVSSPSSAETLSSDLPLALR